MAKLINLDPSSQLVIAGLTGTLVYSIFSLNAPNLADVRHDTPGNTNTYKSVNTATFTAAGTVAAIALISKSPTVWVIGGAMTLFEAWKYHAANFSSHGAQDNPTLAG
jgi:hypothetical protein